MGALFVVSRNTTPMGIDQDEPKWDIFGVIFAGGNRQPWFTDQSVILPHLDAQLLGPLPKLVHITPYKSVEQVLNLAKCGLESHSGRVHLGWHKSGGKYVLGDEPLVRDLRLDDWLEITVDSRSIARDWSRYSSDLKEAWELYHNEVSGLIRYYAVC